MTRSNTAELPSFNTERNVKEIISEILSYIGLDNSCDLNLLYEFLQDLKNYSIENPFRLPKIPEGLRRINIMNRFLENTSWKFNINKYWPQNEITIIDKNLEQNTAMNLTPHDFPSGCTRLQLEIKIRERLEYLHRREWTHFEDKTIRFHMYSTLTKTKLVQILHYKCEEDIDFQIEQLKYFDQSSQMSSFYRSRGYWVPPIISAELFRYANS